MQPTRCVGMNTNSRLVERKHHLKCHKEVQCNIKITNIEGVNLEYIVDGSAEEPVVCILMFVCILIQNH